MGYSAVANLQYMPEEQEPTPPDTSEESEPVDDPSETSQADPTETTTRYRLTESKQPPEPPSAEPPEPSRPDPTERTPVTRTATTDPTQTARVETVNEKATFRDSFERRRLSDSGRRFLRVGAQGEGQAAPLHLCNRRLAFCRQDPGLSPRPRPLDTVVQYLLHTMWNCAQGDAHHGSDRHDRPPLPSPGRWLARDSRRRQHHYDDKPAA